jgi:parvulin-like peptidyl-prolyl isomerase
LDERELQSERTLTRSRSKSAEAVCRWAQALLAEPLVHFLVAGLMLCLAISLYQDQHDRYRIEVTAERVRQLADMYRLQYGEPPSAPAIERLIQIDIGDEILVREGLRLKLDQNDEIVRRRIIQKMQFLSGNLRAPSEPNNAQIEAYYRDHSARYMRAPRVSFTHVFFQSERRARETLLELKASNRRRAPELGDLFPDLNDFADLDADQVQRLFGRSSFSASVFVMPAGVWGGPFESGYGWHLLRVNTRSVAQLPTLDDVREQVRSDWLTAAQEAENRADAIELRKRFTVVRRDRAS